MSYANKLSSFELSFLLRATTAHALPGDDPSRGRKHDWYMVDVWGALMPRCQRCGLLGEAETRADHNSIGWVGKPTFGCPSPTQETPNES